MGRFEWQKADACKDRIKKFVQAKKLTTRLEDIKPSSSFEGKWKDWLKTLQTWHAAQNAYKSMVQAKVAEKAKKNAERAQKIKLIEAKKKAKEQAAKLAAEKKVRDKAAKVKAQEAKAKAKEAKAKAKE